jgi:hypothetical protein
LEFIDHIFILLVFVALPIYSITSTRRYLTGIEAGEPADRVGSYLETITMQWVFLIVLVIAWWFFGRPMTDLGFQSPEGVQLRRGASALFVMIAALVISWFRIKRLGDEEKKKYTDGLGKMVHFLPQTDRDFRYFVSLSITAGIVEEIVYRGFVLWYLGSFMPLWAAVAVSSIGFGVGHLYMGIGAGVRAGLVGLAFAVYYVLTGSIWFPILAHIALDILQGTMAVELLRKSDYERKKHDILDEV